MISFYSCFRLDCIIHMLLFSNVGNLAIRSFSHEHPNIFPRCCCWTLVQDRNLGGWSSSGCWVSRADNSENLWCQFYADVVQGRLKGFSNTSVVESGYAEGRCSSFLMFFFFYLYDYCFPNIMYYCISFFILL
jgi:hypothetical protein